MTISTAAAPLSYAGNGSTTAFAVTWAYKAKSHVVATLRNSLGVETVQVITTNYTLTDAGTSGTLTMGTAPATNETLVITSEPPNTQETDIPLGGSFPASSVEDALDLAAQVSQKVENLFNRSLRVPKTDTKSGSELEIPNETDRADKVLAFDANGEAIAGENIGDWTGDWATSTAYVLRDLIKDTSNNNVYINITAHTSTGSQPISSNADVAKWALVVDAAASAADAVSTAADAVSTAADAVSTAADVVSTAADVVTAEDSNLEAGDWANREEDSLARTYSSGSPTNRAAGNYSGLHWAAKTAADAVATAADLVLTDGDQTATAADVVTTNADVVTTNADVVLTAADVVTAEDSNLEAGDWANRAEDSLTRTFSSASPTNRAAGNYSGLHWGAKTSADATSTAADAVSTAADAVSTAADVTAAEAAANATLWVSGTTYATGDVRYSPIDFLSYRRITDGDGVTDPSSDVTNWVCLTGIVRTALTGSAKIPTGTTGQRDGSPATGYLRYNSTETSFEGYNGTSWGSIGGGATGAGGDTVFQENALIVTTDYTLTTAKNASSVGPITINSGITVTVPSGARWVIL